jgi:hypothetical protein
MRTDLTTLPLFLLTVYALAIIVFILRLASVPAPWDENLGLSLAAGLLVILWRAPRAWRLRLSGAGLAGILLRLALAYLGATSGWPEIVGLVGGLLVFAALWGYPLPTAAAPAPRGAPSVDASAEPRAVRPGW